MADEQQATEGVAAPAPKSRAGLVLWLVVAAIVVLFVLPVVAIMAVTFLGR